MCAASNEAAGKFGWVSPREYFRLRWYQCMTRRNPRWPSRRPGARKTSCGHNSRNCSTNVSGCAASTGGGARHIGALLDEVRNLRLRLSKTENVDADDSKPPAPRPSSASARFSC
jgi:hypothetical protein